MIFQKNGFHNFLSEAMVILEQSLISIFISRLNSSITGDSYSLNHSL